MEYSKAMLFIVSTNLLMKVNINRIINYLFFFFYTLLKRTWPNLNITASDWPTWCVYNLFSVFIFNVYALLCDVALLFF